MTNTQGPIAGSVDPAADAPIARHLDVALDVPSLYERNPARDEREGFDRVEARHGSQTDTATHGALLHVGQLGV